MSLSAVSDRRVGALKDWIRNAARNPQEVAFWLICAVEASAYLIYTRVSLDDAYVYLRVAENMAATGVPFFNASDEFNITTSPAWMIILSVGAKFVGHAGLPMLAKLLFVACLIGAARLLYRLLHQRLPVTALLAPAPVFFASSMLGLAGHDTAIALMTGLGLILSFTRRDKWLPLWAALFFLARPEGAVLAALLCGWVGVEALLARDVMGLIRRMLTPALIAIAIVAAWYIFFFATYGQLLSDTFAIKRLQGHSGWTKFGDAWPGHLLILFDVARPFSVNLATIGLAVIGFFSIARTNALLLVWPVLHYVLYANLGVAYYHWYYYPIEFAAALCLLAGAGAFVGAAASRLSGWTSARRLTLSVLSLALAAIALIPSMRVALTGFSGARAFDARLEAYTEISRYIAAHPRADGAPSTLVAHEIGIFGYLLPRDDIRDVVGLATPVREAEHLWNWDRVVSIYPPDFLLWPFPKPPADKVFGPDRNGRFLILTPVLEAVASTSNTLYARPQAGSSAVAAAFDANQDTFTTMATDGVAQAPIRPFFLDDRIVVFAHAPSELHIPIPDSATAVRIGYGYRPDATEGENRPDGATFRLFVGSSGAPLFEQKLDPIARPEDLGFHTRDIALPAGASGARFVIDSGSTLAADWTYWAPPLFRVRGTWVAPPLRAPLPCPSMADITAHLTTAPVGHVDQITVNSGLISAAGWAASAEWKEPADGVVVAANGIVLGCSRLNKQRPDVAALLGAPRFAQSGFSFEIYAPALSRGENVQIYARGADGSFAPVAMPPAPKSLGYFLMHPGQALQKLRGAAQQDGAGK